MNPQGSGQNMSTTLSKTTTVRTVLGLSTSWFLTILWLICTAGIDIWNMHDLVKQLSCEYTWLNIKAIFWDAPQDASHYILGSREGPFFTKATTRQYRSVHRFTWKLMRGLDSNCAKKGSFTKCSPFGAVNSTRFFFLGFSEPKVC